jgi:hypothetical protein
LEVNDTRWSLPDLLRMFLGAEPNLIMWCMLRLPPG